MSPPWSGPAPPSTSLPGQRAGAWHPFFSVGRPGARLVDAQPFLHWLVQASLAVATSLPSAGVMPLSHVLIFPYPLSEDTSRGVQGLPSIQGDLILRLQIITFQTRSHSQGLGVRTCAFLGGHSVPLHIPTTPCRLRGVYLWPRLGCSEIPPGFLRAS